MELLSLFTKRIAIDLGTTHTVILHNDKIVVDEPSIIAIEKDTDRIMAVGNKALRMHGCSHEHALTIRHLKAGRLADFRNTEMMLKEFIKTRCSKNHLFPSAWKMVICIPFGITEVETRAVRYSAEQAGAKEVWMIYEPMAAAIGIGLDVLSPDASMVIDIGGGASKVAVLALGGIVASRSLQIAGDEFNANIIDYMRRKHNISIDEATAEQIKIRVGSAIEDLDNPPEDYEVCGSDLLQGGMMAVKVNYSEIAGALDHSISEIEGAIRSVLESTPPESVADIYRNGIFLVGGGALLRGLDKRISRATHLPVHVADDPLKAVARGAGIALKYFNQFPFIVK